MSSRSSILFIDQLFFQLLLFLNLRLKIFTPVDDDFNLYFLEFTKLITGFKDRRLHKCIIKKIVFCLADENIHIVKNFLIYLIKKKNVETPIPLLNYRAGLLSDPFYWYRILFYFVKKSRLNSKCAFLIPIGRLNSSHYIVVTRLAEPIYREEGGRKSDIITTVNDVTGKI